MQENNEENNNSPAENNKKTAKAYFRWNTNQETTLIEEYSKNVQEFNDSSKHQGKLWRNLQVRMSKKGITASANSCSNKFKALRSQFKTLYFNENLTEDQKQAKFVHYKILDNLFKQVVDVKIGKKIQELVSMRDTLNKEELDKTIEAEKTQYVVEILNDSGNNSTIQTDSTSSETSTVESPAVEHLYITRETLRLEKNTPLNRASSHISIKNPVGRPLKRRALEPIDQQSEAKNIKVEPKSIKQELSSMKMEPISYIKTSDSVRTKASNLDKILITTGNPGFQIRSHRKQNLNGSDSDYNADKSDNGMVTILNPSDTEISEINYHDNTPSYKTENFSGVIGDQPQSTKNNVTLSSPENTLSPEPQPMVMKPYHRIDIMPKDAKFVLKSNLEKIQKKPDFKPIASKPRYNPRIIQIKRVVQSTKTNPSEDVDSTSSLTSPTSTTIQNARTGAGVNNKDSIENTSSGFIDNSSSMKSADASGLGDDTPIWFQTFMMKFQTFIHRQNSIEEKLDNITTELIKIRKQFKN